MKIDLSVLSAKSISGVVAAIFLALAMGAAWNTQTYVSAIPFSAGSVWWCFGAVLALAQVYLSYSALQYVRSLEYTLSWMAEQTSQKLEFIATKTTYLEARADAAAPKATDVLRHLSQLLTEFDSERGGVHVLRTFFSSLKTSLLSAKWLKSWTSAEIAAEWNLFLRAAIIEVTEAAFYERYVAMQGNYHLDPETIQAHTQTLKNVQRPEISDLYFPDSATRQSQLSFARLFLDQAEASMANLQAKAGPDWAAISQMPLQPGPLPAFAHS